VWHTRHLQEIAVSNVAGLDPVAHPTDGEGETARCGCLRRVSTREQNEKKFRYWETLANGSRRYWFDVVGRQGWTARYVKEVDSKEATVRFYQEIYDTEGKLIETHQKYPEDMGHRKADI